ncbi:MAG: PIG-L deacetylase family protein [Marmoricola sp.]
MPTLRHATDSAIDSPQVVPRVRDRPATANPLVSGERVLLVSAHPDDETIGAGRLVAGHRGEVRALTLTGGEGCVVSDRIDPVDMLTQRLAEWRTAVHVLGAEAVETTRWPDGRLAEHEAEITESLLPLMAASDVVITTWRHDPHPDHRATGRACAAAAALARLRVVEFPVWAPYWMTPEAVAELDYRLCASDSEPGADQARLDALSGYSSQTQPLLPGWAPVVPADMLERHDRQLLACPTR